jgi:V/A-type H+-transporting ATPase subunit E
LLQMANARLAGKGKNGNLKLSGEKREMTGGFVLLSGGVETNCTIPILVQQQYALLEKQVAKVLFEA